MGTILSYTRRACQHTEAEGHQMRLIALTLILWSTMLNAQHQNWQPFVDEIVADGRARTIVVGFYDDGATSTLVAGGAGDRSSIFEIGSITKVFTSLLTQVQVDAERLEWDQTLADSLPDLEFANADVAGITLRELSSHTSGLPRLPANMVLDNMDDPYANYDRKLLLEFLGGFDPDSLDKGYEYSNLGAGLLGEIAADAAGAPYPLAMQRDLLLSLAMESTTSGLRDEFSDRLVIGYSNGADASNWSGFDVLAGAGALTSSVDDMFTFIDSHFHGSAIASSLTAIRTEQGDGTTALGWHLHKTDDKTVHWHNGGTGGYASFLGIDFETRSGVVVLSASTDYDGITDLGFMMMSGDPPAETDADLDISAYIGVYEVGPDFYLTMFEQGGRLHGRATGQAAFPLRQVGENEFSHNAASIIVRFPGTDGEPATTMMFSQGGDEITAPRVDNSLGSLPLDEIDVNPEVLNDYVGQYQFAPGAIITIEARDRQLYAQLTGQQRFAVYPFEADKFYYKVVDAKLYFERNDDDVVTTLTLDQGGLQEARRVEE